MPRLHSTFPRGWQGTGLLLLRGAIGVTLIIQATACLSASHDLRIGISLSCLLALVSAAALVVGFLTPIANALAILSALGIMFVSPSTVSWNFLSGNPLSFDILIMAVVSAVLGPGAFSLDASLFGRRKVIIPRSSHSQVPLSSSSRPPVSSPSRVPNSSPSQPPKS